MHPTTAALLLAINVGRIALLGRDGIMSGIDKRPVVRAVRIGFTGLAGDEQGDQLHHGGPDKALHHYPAEHYACWRAELPERAALFENGGFGENLSTRGLTEDTVCLGDVWRLGGAVLQISQGRQPCRRLNLRFDLPDMVQRVWESGRSGWYYRVLEPGIARPDDVLALIERPHPEWSVRRLTDVLFAPILDRPALATLAGLSALSANWRERAARRLIEASRGPSI